MRSLKKTFQVILATSTLITSTFVGAGVKPQTSGTVEPSDANLHTEEAPNFLVSAASPVFILKLKSNPTTGFSWFMREYDDRLIIPIKHAYQSPTGKLMGAPGYDIWTFKVKPAGFVVPQQTVLRMVYARPWAPDSSTQVVFRVSTGA